MPIATVITADIVQSSKLTKKQFNALIKAFQSLMQPHAHEFYRGDSFQIYLPQNEQAIRLALALRLAVKKMDVDINADLRIAIGIGNIKSAVPDLRISTEAPFVLSGRALDKLTSQVQYFAIECEKKNAEQSFRLMARFIDYLFKNITSKQAAVVYELVLGQTQTNTAKKLKKSQATINKQAHAAGWPELEQLINEYLLTLAQL